MAKCGVPTMTCVLLLLFMAALYASASLRPDEDLTIGDKVKVDNTVHESDLATVNLRIPRALDGGELMRGVDMNKRGRQGRIADSGGETDPEDSQSMVRPRGKNRENERRPAPAGSRRSIKRMMKFADKLGNAVSPFAGKLWTTLVPRVTSNTLFSPLSVHTVLTMAMLGARKRTRRELSNVLGMMAPSALKKAGLQNKKAYKAYQGLISSLGNIHENVKLFTANAAFVKPKIPLEASFRDGLRQIFNASFDNFDMNHPQGPEQPINDWIANVTREKIQNLIPPGTITDLTAMMLVNAIYFNATWNVPFKTDQTRLEDFTTLSQGVKKVHMMQSTDYYNYAYYDNFEVLEIPYSGDRLAMYILLPREDSDIHDVLDDITKTVLYGSNPLEQWFQKMTGGKFDLQLPRFQIDSGLLHLNSPLQNMGVGRMFDGDKADFSGISASGNLFISDVFHRAFISVNEAGTEAAASTGIGIETISLPPPFIVNRPFLFVIRDKSMKLILFMGAYVGH